jgi:hypothetical protein
MIGFADRALPLLKFGWAARDSGNPRILRAMEWLVAEIAPDPSHRELFAEAERKGGWAPSQWIGDRTSARECRRRKKNIRQGRDITLETSLRTIDQ